MLIRSTTLMSCLLAILLGASSFSHAGPDGHYRWTDENGKVHYSDRPPAGVDAEFIRFTGSKSSPKPSTPEGEENTAGAKAEGATPPGTLEVEPETPKDPKICAQAQSNLKALSGNPKVRITETDGSKRLLTNDEKEAQRERARGFIKLYCD